MLGSDGEVRSGCAWKSWPSPVAGEVDTTSILTGEPVDLTAWIAEDGRVLRIEEEGPLTKSESKDVVRAITFSAFDEPVEISAPE